MKMMKIQKESSDEEDEEEDDDDDELDTDKEVTTFCICASHIC